jgi:hypothetical protein
MVYRHSPLQLSFESFGAGLSTPLSSNNEWIQLAEVMPGKLSMRHTNWSSPKMRDVRQNHFVYSMGQS